VKKQNKMNLNTLKLKDL